MGGTMTALQRAGSALADRFANSSNRAADRYSAVPKNRAASPLGEARSANRSAHTNLQPDHTGLALTAASAPNIRLCRSPELGGSGDRSAVGGEQP